MDILLKAMKALSGETRLRVLNLLLERECCVCEVMQALDISQTRASRNLGALHQAGLLRLRKDGLWSFYSIDRAALRPPLAELVQAMAGALAADPAAARDRQRLAQAVRSGPGCALPETSRQSPAPPAKSKDGGCCVH